MTMQKYLRTSYRPDCDYVDGILIDRNVGLRDHSKAMGQSSPGFGAGRWRRFPHSEYR
jgi:hypothetical protein